MKMPRGKMISKAVICTRGRKLEGKVQIKKLSALRKKLLPVTVPTVGEHEQKGKHQLIR